MQGRRERKRGKRRTPRAQRSLICVRRTLTANITPFSAGLFPTISRLSEGHSPLQWVHHNHLGADEHHCQNPAENPAVCLCGRKAEAILFQAWLRLLRARVEESKEDDSRSSFEVVLGTHFVSRTLVWSCWLSCSEPRHPCPTNTLLPLSRVPSH